LKDSEPLRAVENQEPPKVTKPFRATGAEMAAQWGIGDFRFLDIPHPIANLTESELDQRVENMVEDVLKLFLDGQS
jgi:hypothetical protein